MSLASKGPRISLSRDTFGPFPHESELANRQTSTICGSWLNVTRISWRILRFHGGARFCPTIRLLFFRPSGMGERLSTMRECGMRSRRIGGRSMQRKPCSCGCGSLEPNVKRGHANLGRKHTPEARAKISAGRTGIRHSEETRRHLSEIRRIPWGQMSWAAKHKWARKNFEDPGLCEVCGVEWMRLEWASIGHTYTQNRVDWKRLCTRCHSRMDHRKTG